MICLQAPPIALPAAESIIDKFGGIGVAVVILCVGIYFLAKQYRDNQKKQELIYAEQRAKLDKYIEQDRDKMIQLQQQTALALAENSRVISENTQVIKQFLNNGHPY